tara:strand:+ start:34839 stop:35768 length:930 start_codon:yes stop_codon:yes gene_type:complete
MKVSIIFQGPVVFFRGKNLTKNAIVSALKFFQGAEIILSTWRGQKLDEIKQLNVKIILNEDPGSEIRKDYPKTYHNANRIILSSFQGLKNASNDLIIKCRSDIIFKNQQCLNYFKLYKKYDNNFKILDNKVVVSNQTTINTKYGPKLLYHICDWFFLGNKKDLLKIFNINFIKDEDVRYYSISTKPENIIDKNNISRYMAEDYITHKFISKYIKIRHDYYCDFDLVEKEKFERILSSNFVVVDNNKLGFKAGKYYNLSIRYLWKSYTYNEWKSLYRKYILYEKSNRFDIDRIKLSFLNPIKSLIFFLKK